MISYLRSNVLILFIRAKYDHVSSAIFGTISDNLRFRDGQRGERIFKISLLMHMKIICCTMYACVRYLLYFISDTLQDAEKDKEETEYMLQENGKPMYE